MIDETQIKQSAENENTRQDATARSSSLTERLEGKPGVQDTKHPFYWYFHLDGMGKQAQTREMVDEAVRNFIVDNRSYTILRVIAKKYLTREVCEIAVRQNGLNLKYVPECYRDARMCLGAVESDGAALAKVPEQVLLGDDGFRICSLAICNDFEGRSLAFVPDCYLCGEKGRVLCEAAVKSNGYALEFVPDHLMTKEIVELAVGCPLPVRNFHWPDGSCSTRSACRSDEPVLSLVPERYVTREIVALSARANPESLQWAPAECVSLELCLELIRQDPMNLQYCQSPSEKVVTCAVKADPRAILMVPEPLLTIELCRDAMRRDPSIPIERFPDRIYEMLKDEFQSQFINYEPLILETPAPVEEDVQMLSFSEGAHVFDLSTTDGSFESIYYITDLHLEHQLAAGSSDVMKLSMPEVRARVKEKVSELLTSVSDANGMLLVGGDVADSVELEAMFYEELSSYVHGWRGRIFAVLGNHELWDGDPRGLQTPRSIDETIADYRQAMPSSVVMLENELLIDYKGLRTEILDEQTILGSSIEELAAVCDNSTFILLGGIGFSGLNPLYNAKMGLYARAVSPEEDVLRSERFRAIYEKVLASAGNHRVIVLTHTQKENWSDAQYNPNWIYVSGHTHQNTLLLQDDGVAVFSDNQVGYKPTRWFLKGFSIDVKKYDPFESFADGIYCITREQYIEFNRCQGINMQGMRYSGNLFALKYDGVYMFVLDGAKSLCLLEGGKRHKLDYNISYYLDHLPEYVQKMRSAFAPYQKAISIISEEIKEIGGIGRVHGCIVDIDWFNHVYLNPFDGRITPYFALDMTEKLAFKNLGALLKSSPIPPRLSDGSLMSVRYSSASKEGKLPVLSRGENKRWPLATVPKAIMDRSMYEPSRIMRSIQYIFDQKVLRIWNDSILDIGERADANFLGPADSLERLS